MYMSAIPHTLPTAVRHDKGKVPVGDACEPARIRHGGGAAGGRSLSLTIQPAGVAERLHRLQLQFHEHDAWNPVVVIASGTAESDGPVKLYGDRHCRGHRIEQHETRATGASPFDCTLNKPATQAMSACSCVHPQTLQFTCCGRAVTGHDSNADATHGQCVHKTKEQDAARRRPHLCECLEFLAVNMDVG